MLFRCLVFIRQLSCGRAHGHRHHSHARRDALADLLQEHRPRAVGDRRIHLEAAVDRPRVHDDRVRPGGLEALVGETVKAEVLMLVGQQGAVIGSFQLSVGELPHA